MHNEEIIEKIKTLELSVKPTLKIAYISKNRKYVDLFTGDIIDSAEDIRTKYYCIYPCTGATSTTQKRYATYYEYIPEIESVACMYCSLDTRIFDFPIKRRWEIEDVFFITKRKECIMMINGEWKVFTEKYQNLLPFCIGTSGVDNHYYYNDGSCYNPNMESEFAKLFPSVKFSGTEVATIKNANVLYKFLSQKEQKKKTGPKQRLIDELTSYDLDDFTITKEQYDKIGTAHYSKTKQIVRLDKVKENICCLRWFEVTDNGPKSKQQFTSIEKLRLYVTDKDFIGCKTNNYGEFVQFRLNSGKSNFMGEIINFNKSVFEGTLLKYFSDIFDEIPKTKQSQMIWALLQFPILEKIYKDGLSKLVLSSLDYYSEHPISHFEKYFGTIYTNKKNLSNFFGLNKYQYKKYKDFAIDNNAYNTNVITAIKSILTDGATIEDIDNKTFDELFDKFVEQMKKNVTSTTSYYAYTVDGMIIHCLTKIRQLYSVKTMFNLADKVIELSGCGGRTYHSPIRNYFDYLNMVKQLDDTKHFRPDFEMPEDVTRMHDGIISVYNLKRNEYRTKQFKEHIPKWQKFAFDDDEQFCVIAPEHPGELATEGIILHHCVKSYIERVTDGKTNILFIRKKDEITKPFFTVEIGNDGKIEQVHGLCNRNIDTEKDLPDFVKKWAKKKKLQLTNIDKVR